MPLLKLAKHHFKLARHREGGVILNGCGKSQIFRQHTFPDHRALLEALADGRATDNLWLVIVPLPGQARFPQLHIHVGRYCVAGHAPAIGVNDPRNAVDSLRRIRRKVGTVP